MKNKEGAEKKLRTLLLIFSECDFLEDKNIEKLIARFAAIQNEGIENLIVYVDILKEIGAEKRDHLAQIIAEKIRTAADKNESDFVHILSKEIEKTDRLAFSNKPEFAVYFVLNLGGREELKQILEEIIQSGTAEKTNDAQEFIQGRLVIPLEPDLIMSNLKNTLTDFMIWQTAYSEYYFFEKEMNRLTDSDFRKAFESFRKRDRRYGV